MSTVPVEIASRPGFDAGLSMPRLLSGGPGAGAAMPPVTDAPAPTIEAQLKTGAVGDAAAQLAQLPPGERAGTLGTLNETDRMALIASLSTAVLADTFGSMPPDEIAGLSPLLNVRRMAAVLDKTPPKLAADVLRIIDWGDAGQILARMQGRKAIGSLLLYSDESTGGLMATEVVGLHVEWPASYAITVLRNSGLKPEKLEQLFAVNRDGVLLGRLELSELMFAPAGA
ncbi:MAG: magnesium transporter, partial [Chloroflexi bacterium]|nr:magnesium transporter [Chloroflexota bacterium]